MNDTPRTDAEVFKPLAEAGEAVWAEFARQLERENKRLREALLELVAYAKPFMRDEWQEQALTRARAALESK